MHLMLILTEKDSYTLYNEGRLIILRVDKDYMIYIKENSVNASIDDFQVVH